MSRSLADACGAVCWIAHWDWKAIKVTRVGPPVRECLGFEHRRRSL